MSWSTPTSAIEVTGDGDTASATVTSTSTVPATAEWYDGGVLSGPLLRMFGPNATALKSAFKDADDKSAWNPEADQELDFAEEAEVESWTSRFGLDVARWITYIESTSTAGTYAVAPASGGTWSVYRTRVPGLRHVDLSTWRASLAIQYDSAGYGVSQRYAKLDPLLRGKPKSGLRDESAPPIWRTEPPSPGAASTSGVLYV